MQDRRAWHPQDCASLLAALAVHPRVAMRILRHGKIAVTMEIYTEAPSDALATPSASSATGSHDRLNP
jgi:hypothetical protein